MEGTERRWGPTAVLLPPERGDRPYVPYEPVFYERTVTRVGALVHVPAPELTTLPVRRDAGRRTVRLRTWQLVAIVGAAALVGVVVGRAVTPTPRNAPKKVLAAGGTGPSTSVASTTPLANQPSAGAPAPQAPAATAAPAAAGQGPRLLLDLRRETGPKRTQHFLLTGGRWILGWAYDCTGKGGDSAFQVTIYTPDGLPSSEGGVNQRGTKGSSIAAYTSTGERYLGVQTNCVWAIRVTA